MIKMNWTHSSKSILCGVLLAVALVAVGTAAAVTVEGTAPAATETGESVTMETTVVEPFRDAPNQWTLEGTTELENATWTVQVLAQGDPIDTLDAGGESFSYDLDRENGATEVQIEVTGEVPSLSSYSYEELETENYTAMTVARVSDGNTNELRTWRAHRYTEESQNARSAIDQAIEAVGEQNDKIGQAISAYDSQNFGNAIDLAEEAENNAQSAEQTTQLLMIGGGVLVVLLVVGGGLYAYRQRQQSSHKLR